MLRDTAGDMEEQPAQVSEPEQSVDQSERGAKRKEKKDVRKLLRWLCGKRQEDGDLPSLTRFLSLSKDERPGLAIAAVLMVFSKGGELATPMVLGQAIDSTAGFTDADPDDLWNHMAYLFALNTGASILGATQQVIFGVAGERVVARLRRKLFHAILQQEIGMFDLRKSAELVSRLGPDANTIRQVVTRSFIDLASDTVKIVVALGFMLISNWVLCLLMLGIAPLMLFTAVPFGKFIGRVSKEYQDSVALFADISQEAIGNMRTVRSFAAEAYEHSRYCRIVGDPARSKNSSLCWWPPKDGSSLRIGTYSTVVGVIFGTLTTWFFMTYITFVIWFAFGLVIRGESTLGALTAFLTYGFQVLGAVGGVSRNISALFAAQGASARVFELIDREPLLPTSGGLCLDKGIKGDVRFDNVHFSYPSRPDVQVIKAATFHVPANSMAAFVGASGNGKSTMLVLVQRFYDISSGAILFDNVSVKEIDPSWLRRQMAYVQQEPILFGTSIRDNLLYGRCARAYSLGSPDVLESSPDKCEIELFHASKKANAWEFISGFPEGFDTLVGERGIKVSGGQKQRLAIARAILCDPRILLLDEATSALDARSERLVKESLDNLMQGRTRLVVAHRLSTVRDADQIMVVDAGRIVECGSHEELLLSGLRYQELVGNQLQQPATALVLSV